MSYGEPTNNSVLDDPEIGQVKFYVKHWERSTDGVQFDELKAKPCAREDISVGEGQARNDYGFYPMEPDTVGNLEAVMGELQCIDQDFSLKGHFDSQSTRNLMVVYELCDPKKRKCKSPEAIEQALQYTYMLVIENRETYKH